MERACSNWPADNQIRRDERSGSKKLSATNYTLPECDPWPRPGPTSSTNIAAGRGQTTCCDASMECVEKRCLLPVTALQFYSFHGSKLLFSGERKSTVYPTEVACRSCRRRSLVESVLGGWGVVVYARGPTFQEAARDQARYCSPIHRDLYE